MEDTILCYRFKFLLALQLLLAKPPSIKWILLATQNFHSRLASGRFPHCMHESLILITGSKHRSNIQGNEENSNRKPHLLLKPETNTETKTNFRILPIYFFFGLKNVRVGRSIGNTHIFFWGLIQLPNSLSHPGPQDCILEYYCKFNHIAGIQPGF